MSHAIISSVLMSVYERVSLTELRACLGSLLHQTRPADEIVIVIDGPISDSLRGILEAFQSRSEEPVVLVPLSENKGLVEALNQGLKHCRGEWIFRMDADDISLPHRFEKQLQFVERRVEIDVLGTAMLEFEHDPTHPDRVKGVRSGHALITRAMALRNPINHPTVCMRRAKLESVGGYPELPLLEDYFLWAQLALSGAVFENLTEPLYLFRFDDATLDRRGGLRNFKNEIWLRRWMRREGLISATQLIIATTLQCVLRLTPLALRRFLWHQSRRNVQESVVVPSSFQE